VFVSGALWEETKKNLKTGEEQKVQLVEAPISMVDGSSSSHLVYINDPQTLQGLCTMWNNWLKTSGVQAFSVQTGTLGTEAGINALCSIAMSRIWIPVPGGKSEKGSQEHKTDRRRSVKGEKRNIVNIRRKAQKYRGLTSTVYANKSAIVDVSQGEILAAPYEQIMQTWILPIDEDEYVPSTDQSTSVQRWQFMMDEPYSNSRTSSDAGITLASLHMAYASKMVKANLAAVDDQTAFFNEMARLGRGGILSGIVANLVGSAFPALGGVANSIAGALPF